MTFCLLSVYSVSITTVKPLIRDTPKDDKPPNKGQAESTHVYTLYRKSPLKEDNLSTKDWSQKMSLLRSSTVPVTSKQLFVIDS